MEQIPDVHTLPDNNDITALDYSGEDMRLLAGDTQGWVHVYKARDRLDCCASFQSHGDIIDTDTENSESRALTSVSHLHALPSGFLLLAANTKTIKLWRLSSKASLRKHYRNAHQCHIHSVSVNTSKQHFLSADDLRINLWDVNHEEKAYCLADFTPTKIKMLREVLLHACFSRSEAGQMLYTSTSGAVRVCDLRLRSSAMQPALEFRLQSPRGSTDILASVTSADFSESGQLVYARDLHNVNVWDVRQGVGPIATVPIILRQIGSSLCFDMQGKFQVKSRSPDSFVTGGLGSEVVIACQSGEFYRTDLNLGAANLPTVTCNPAGAEVFAAAQNKVAVLRDSHQNLGMS